MKIPKNRREFYFFQTLLCLLLIAACIAVKGIKSRVCVSVGSFGTAKAVENLTFSDLAEKLFSECDG